MNKDLLRINYNPDVLSCLSNLSNDEVFTPPSLANELLDMLPKSLFSDPHTKFLDPCCKSGVFLREIAKRLIKGLETAYPNLEERLDHIFREQLYGISITELTGELSRRSVYCSKTANGQYSVANFENETGNISYCNQNHTFKNGACIYCGVSESVYGNSKRKSLEKHAYEFIHNINKEFNSMKFDVIIGNPPYHLKDGGGDGSSAKPIYNKFIEKAKKLDPQYLIMIIPARWYSGGKGLDEFRKNMLEDDKISVIHDFPETADCFPGINIRGGVCYFLREKNHKGNCLVYNHKNGSVDVMSRPLKEEGIESFIRYNKAIPIIKKVMSFQEKTLSSRVSSRLPFGIPSNFIDYSLKKDEEHSVVLYRSERNKNAPREVYVNPSFISKNLDLKDKIKVIVSKASPGGDEFPHSVISTPILSDKNSVCTETYLIVDVVNTVQEGLNLISYMKTKFFRFMMAMVKNTQNISKSVFSLVPIQNLSKEWSDTELYQKYKLSKDDISFIDSLIKSMEK